MNEERVCLDYLLHELRRWQEEGRLPLALAQPLYDDYTARRAALEPPHRIPPIRPAPMPETPAQRKGFVAFLEERNIAALHLVGSLLLLVGLVLLVQWQWDGIGRFLLLAVFALSTVGLLRLSDQLQDKHPQSARVLSLLGLLLVPLCGIATRVFGLVGALSWPLTILLTSVVTGSVTLWRLRRTEEPILIGLLAAAGASAVWGGAGLLPSAFVWPSGITGLLSLATLSFWCVGRGKAKWDLPCTLSGHALTLLGIGSGLLWSAQAGGNLAQAGLGLTLLGAAGLYGFTGHRLQVSWLGFAATATAALGAQLLVPESASLVARGATLAATGALSALVARFQDAKDTPYQKSAELLTLLGLFPLLLDFAPQDIALVGLFAAQALLWLAVAPTERGRTFVALHALAASRLLAIPVDSWFVSITALSANEPRWLLLSALALALLGQRRVAIGALVWAGLAQLPGFFSATTAPAANGVLLIEALGMGLWGLWQKQSLARRGALLPLGTAALVQWLWWATGTVLLPLPVFALAFAILGSTFIDRQNRGIRALLWLLSAGHLAASLLPAPLLPFWALALVPVLLWLDSKEDTDETHLQLTEFFTGLSFLTFVLLPCGLSSLSIAVTGGVLSLVPLRRHTAPGVAVSMVLATATMTLTLSGYPHPHFSLAQVGLLLAGTSALWQGLAVALRRRTTLWETVSQVGVATTGIAVLAALTGLSIADQGRWTILALLVSAATLGATAGIQRRASYAHSAFACAFSAYALYFYDRFGLGIDRFDFFFLPLGLYLLFVAERTREGALRGVGLLSLLGPSLLAVCADSSHGGHAVLLTLECLLAVTAGIHQRVKVYLGGGVLFLIALLVIKLWDPLREINFGVYLTLLGAGVLVAAVQFEKRRDQLRRWTSSLRETYATWD